MVQEGIRMTLVKKENKKSRTKIKKVGYINSIIPIIRYLDEPDCFELKDGSYMDLLQINTKDLENTSEAEIEFDVMKYAKLYKIYADDLKIISMNFPCVTLEQQNYLMHKISNTKNIVLKKRLQIKLNTLIQIEKERTRKEFYIMCFSKSLEEHYKNRNTFRIYMETVGRGSMIEELSRQKKERILFKMNNMSTAI